MQGIDTVKWATLAASLALQSSDVGDIVTDKDSQDNIYSELKFETDLPTVALPTSFSYNFNRIPVEGGRYYLKLLKKIKLSFEPPVSTFSNENKFEAFTDTCRVTVVDWDISCNYADLDRELVRKFKFLYSKAMRRVLSQEERLLYHHISHYVDIRDFEDSNAMEIRAVATLISNKQKCIVEWRGGHREVLSSKLGNMLSEVNIGEDFSCMVVRHGGETTDIKNIFPISPIVNTEEILHKYNLI